MRYVRGTVLALVVFILCANATYAKTTGFKETGKKKYGDDVVRTYEHKASGLEVYWIQNNDINKSFVLGVKTPTTDDTGVNHIIEHTLFTGSRDYPSASLFFDASQAYPNTYMNALTSGDMTIFPFSTPYNVCYEKLMSVYLDAVFHPNLLEEPYGFYEEGFHHVPSEGRDGGVVYNEMKGAGSSTDRIIYRNIRNTLFEGTHYAHDSGGVPEAIPTLTYDKFVETYKKYYYPANMRIILYGNINIDEALSKIAASISDVDYVNKKDVIDLSVKSNEDKKIQAKKVLEGTDNVSLIKSFVIDNDTSVTDIQDLDLWMSAYLMSPQSFFQKSLLKAGIHVKWLKDDDLPCTVYTLVLSDIPQNKVKLCNGLIEFLLNKVPSNFNTNVLLEQDIIRESKWNWNQLDEGNNRGIQIAENILDGWAHGREINQYFLKRDQALSMKNLNTEIGELLLNADRYTLFLLPKDKQIVASDESKVGVDNAEDEKAVATTQIGTLTDQEWTSVYENMKKWQQEKANLDPIELDDLIIMPDDVPKIEKKDSYWTMTSKIDSELIRSALYINTSNIDQNELPYLFLYSYLLESASRDITPFSGVLDTSCTAYPLKDGEYWPCFKLVTVTPKEEEEHDILLNQARNYLKAKSNKWYRQKILEYTMGVKELTNSSSIAILNQLCQSGGGTRGEYLYAQSFPLYDFCKNMLNDKEDKWIDSIKAIDDKLYHKNGVIISTSTNNPSKDKCLANWENKVSEWPDAPNVAANYSFDVPQGDYVVKSNAAIDYSFRALRKEDTVDGIDYLLSAYLTKNYLNPQIRVKLGAYGTACQVYDLKTIGIYTYRDPDYTRSAQVIEGSDEFLSKNINDTKLNLSKAEALSNVHNQFKLLANGIDRVGVMEHLILWGNSPKQILKIEQEIVNATPQDIENRQKEYQENLQKGKKGIMTSKDYQGDEDYTIYVY